MPTLGDVLAAIRSTGVPFSTGNWPPNQSPDMPYVIVLPMESRNFHADDAITFEAVSYDVQLYTSKHDFPLERQIRAALKEAGAVFSTNHVEDEENRYVLTYFSMTLRD